MGGLTNQILPTQVLWLGFLRGGPARPPTIALSRRYGRTYPVKEFNGCAIRPHKQWVRSIVAEKYPPPGDARLRTTTVHVAMLMGVAATH